MNNLKQWNEEAKEYTEIIVKNQERFLCCNNLYHEMDIELQKGLNVIKEAEKLLGMLELLDEVMDYLNFGRTEAVKRMLSEQLEAIRKAL